MLSTVRKMDNLIVDLDKVLDDFEAEEKASFSPKQDNEVITDGSSLNSDPSWQVKNIPSQTTKDVYDIPYLPGEKIDLSEANFSPSLCRSSKKPCLIEKDENIESFMEDSNNYSGDNSSYQKQEVKWKLPIQVADDDSRTYILDGADQISDFSVFSNQQLIDGNQITSQSQNSPVPVQNIKQLNNFSSITVKDSPVLESVDSGCPPEPSSVSPTSPLTREIIENGLSLSSSDDSLEITQITNRLLHENPRNLKPTCSSNNSGHTEHFPKFLDNSENSYSSAVKDIGNNCYKVPDNDISKNICDASDSKQEIVPSVKPDQPIVLMQTESFEPSNAVGFGDVDIILTNEELEKYLEDEKYPQLDLRNEQNLLSDQTEQSVITDGSMNSTVIKTLLINDANDFGTKQLPQTNTDNAEYVNMGTSDFDTDIHQHMQEAAKTDDSSLSNSHISSAIVPANEKHCDSHQVKSLVSQESESSHDQLGLIGNTECHTEKTDNNDQQKMVKQISQIPKINTGVSSIHGFPSHDYNISSTNGRPAFSPGTCSELEAVREHKPANKLRKKNRPNSLLGLSKVSLDLSVSSASSDAINKDSGKENLTADLASSSGTGILMLPDEIVNNEISRSDDAVNSSVISSASLGEGMSELATDVSNVETVNTVVVPENDYASELEEPAVMRRPNNSNILCLDNTIPTRPHSWGPASNSTPPPLRNRRPTSLNLPSRSEFPARDGSAFSLPSQAVEELDENADVSEAGQTGVDDFMNTEVHTSIECSGESSEGSVDPHADETYGASSNDVPPPLSELPPYHHTSLGMMAPHWVPDSEAPSCMGCEARFTFTKRRHHCRACGKIFCSTCCNVKSRLLFMESKEARVCHTCHQQITMGTQKKGEPKQVMFSDGIRPGGDLTELDGSSERIPQRRLGRPQRKVESQSREMQHSPVPARRRAVEHARNSCLIPDGGIPPVIPSIGNLEDCPMEESTDIDKLLDQIRDEEAEPVIFAVNANLHVMVKYANLDCCVSRECWCFTSKGMCTVGQEELVIVLEISTQESTIPRDIFMHFHNVYMEAGKGNTVSDMGHTLFSQPFLESREHGGFLYIRPTFQCLQKLVLPEPPFIFGILLQKWETPWAKVFPIRLMLRLGAEYRYYPCPLISVRNRKPVLFEIGHTIMNLLADFRNFQYMLPQIKGITIHMGDKQTTISFPRNRYDDLMKVVSNSNEHVMAVGSCFSAEADSHLVCIQNDDGNYQTQAINIQNKTRKVTGASFVVFNGALKSSSGLKAKSSIVEDGLMVQITPDSMIALKHAMKDMKDYTIHCGSVTASKPDEIVTVRWVEDDRSVNIGVKSPVDKMSMDGIESIYIHNATDYIGENRMVRWTEVFFIRNEDSGSSKWEPVDLSRLAETLSSACCVALTPHLDRLKEASLTKLGLRVTVEAENVGYEIGAKGLKLPDFYMNDLDNELIPVIHSAATQNHDGPIILELIFHVLE